MITLIIIGVTVIVSLIAFQNTEYMYKLLFIPTRIYNNNEYYRLISHGFIHKDYWHLAVNMFVLLMFGQKSEQVFLDFFPWGKYVYLLFYILSLVMSSIVSLVRYKDSVGYSALGASGAVSATVFIGILIDPATSICLYGVLCLPGFIWGIAYLVWEYYSFAKGRTKYGHEAHITGAIFGFTFLLLFYPYLFMRFINIIISLVI